MPSAGFAQTETAPLGIATGDLNGDGIPDLAVAIGGAPTEFLGNVSVLLGLGNGRFQPRVDYATGANSSLTIALGDIDGDGDLDIAASQHFQTTLSLLLNQGDGTFAPKVDQAVPAAVTGIALADLDGKNGPDLLTTSEDETVNVQFNLGDGTFGGSTDYDVAGKAQGVQTADVNGDDLLDVIVISNYAPNKVSVFLNQGNGALGARVDYASYGNNTNGPALALGDLNDDGFPDIATVGPSTRDTSSASILLNNGDGSFGARANYPFTMRTAPDHRVAMGDFNDDGTLDVALIHPADTNYGEYLGSAVVMLNDGDGTFSQAAMHLLGIRMADVASADFNQDGRADLAITHYHNVSSVEPRNGNVVNVVLTYPDGSLASGEPYLAGNGPYAISVGNVDSDSALDLVVANVGDMSEPGSSISVFHNTGDGDFYAPVDFETGSLPQAVKLADMNGDTWLDAVVASTSLVSVLPNDHNGSFGARLDSPGILSPRDLVTGDFNGDLKPDVAVVSWNADTLTVLLNSGTGLLTTNATYPTGRTPYAVVTADFNRDGRLDLAVNNSEYNTSTVSVFINTGNGNFLSKVDYNTGRSPTSLVATDLNQDGLVDLATANLDDNTVSVLRGLGNGKFQAKVDYMSGVEPTWLKAVDLDNDGLTDLAVAHYGMLSTLINTGSGFSGPFAYDARLFTNSLEAGDLDGDGRSDLVTTNENGLLNVYPNRCWQ